MADPKKYLLLLRRWVLQNLVPEWYWPKTISVDTVPIRIRNTPYTFGTRWLIKKGLYEKEERALLLQILKPGMQVIEMGGSIGILSAVMAHAIGKEGLLVSVEASPKLTAYSKKWLEKTGNVNIVTGFAFPVWQAPAVSVKSFDEAAGSLGGTLSFEILQSEKSTTDNSIYDIQRLCTKFSMQPNVLAIDVEGSELIMARQPIQLPSSVKFLLIELHDGIYPNGKKDEAEIHQSILSDGFILKQRLANVCLYHR